MEGLGGIEGTDAPGRGLAGRLLIAPPSLHDPNFDGTVVLVLVHNGDGAFGVVLNRASDLPVGRVLPDWVDRCSSPAVVFTGGPVETDAAIALGLADGERVGAGWSGMVGRLGTVDLHREPSEIGALEAVRIFLGYSGWGPGQLDGELALGGWIVADSLPADAFDADPATLWRRVLRRQSGETRWVSLHPVDPSLN